ncbi:hypothetical protein ACIXNN_04405 [Bacteroides fragilis]
MNHGNGRMDKRTATPLSGRATPQGVDGSDETDKKVRPGKGVPEADGTGQAVQEVRGCDYPSCLPVVKLAPVPDTGKNGGNGQVRIDDGIENTYFMEKNGCWLADVNPEKADSVHGMLAMHTFMRDAYLKVYPESKQERPSPEEVRSSVRILDFHRKESDVWELCNLAVYLMPPSRYVALRYGLADDYDRLDRLHRSGPEPAYDEGVALESRLCRNAEKAAESIGDVRLPDFYLEKLNGELENLGRIAASPDAVHDILHISPDFLTKYGIDKNASATERSCQAEKAYRELDARFVRMTGRRPYADEFFAFLRHGKEKVAEVDRPRPVHKPILRNPPSKGRKMGI